MTTTHHTDYGSSITRQSDHWQLQIAKNKLSQLVKHAQQQGPQFITLHGTEAAVVLSVEEYHKLIKPTQTLVSFFRNSPFVEEEDFSFERDKDTGRDVDL